jgi:hypothetical protein
MIEFIIFIIGGFIVLFMTILWFAVIIKVIIDAIIEYWEKKK